MASISAVTSAAVPVAFACSNAAVSDSASSSLKMASSAHFGGVRLTMAAPSTSRSLRALVVRAEDEPSNILDNVKDQANKAGSDLKSASQKASDNVSGAFGKAENASEQGTRDVKSKADNVKRQAEGKGSDLGSKAEELKDNIAGSVQGAGENLKSGAQSVQQKIESAVDSAKGGAEDVKKEVKKKQ